MRSDMFSAIKREQNSPGDAAESFREKSKTKR